ncbi:MAG: SufD family Fe-S cluster assembly protein [Eubacteriales bacterium]|nr:SufD family Fe-S cluster assembly protein [Eubacteriales bacterium]
MLSENTVKNQQLVNGEHLAANQEKANSKQELFSGTAKYVERKATDIIPIPTFRSAKVNSSAVPELEFSRPKELKRLELLAGEKYVETEEIKLSASEPELYERREIFAREGSDAELILAYSDSGELRTKRHTEVEIRAEAGSHLIIFLVQQMSEQADSRMFVNVYLEPDSEVRMIIADSGARTHRLDLKADLQDRAIFDCQGIYFGRGEESYDYNYELIHKGKLCRSNLLVNGALMDYAKKVFRATIDFRRGSSGSVGDESEYVTLLDDTVQSRAIPLLLSTEDNVEGNHAASAGRLNPDMVFYVQSRGFTRREAEKMIIASRFSNVIDLLPNSELKDAVLKDILTKLDSAD